MKKIFTVLVLLFTGTAAFSQSKTTYTFNKTEAIESTSMVVVSANKEGKVSFEQNSRLLFIDTHNNSSSYLDLPDPYRIIKISVNNPGKFKGRHYVIFTAKTDDWNSTNKVNWYDPNFLFICNERGKDVQRISPPNFDVKSWSVNPQTHTITFVGTEDTNKNKRFDKNDIDKMYIFDLNGEGSLKEIHMPGSIADKIEIPD